MTKLRNVMVALLMVMVSLSGLTVAASPASAASCHGVHRYDTDHHNDGSSGNDEWYFKVSIHYTFCRAPGPNYVKGPYDVVYGYNQEGSHMDCNEFNGGNNVLVYVGMNPYFSDGGGRNFNPGEVRIPCSTSTHNVSSRHYSGERLYHANGQAPRIRVNWSIHKTGVFFEGHGTMVAALRECSGKALTTC